MLRLANREQVLEMDVASIEPERGDAVVRIKVASHGYTGHNEVWVDKEALRSFCSSLVELERSLKGQALIESMSPGELKVELLSVSSRGHFAVRGSTGYHIHGENGTYWHAVSFGFELELSELSRAVSEQWVQRHVG